MKQLLLLLLITSLSGYLLPNGNRSAEKQLLREISAPSNVESIKAKVYEFGDDGHKLMSELELHEQQEIAMICAMLVNKKTRFYYATVPSPNATLAINYKDRDGKSHVTYLHLSGSSLFVRNDAYIELSGAEREQLHRILSK